LKILERIRLNLLLDYLVPCILGIQRQQICVELKHLGSSGFAFVFGGLCGKLGLVIVSLILIVKFWGCGAGASAKAAPALVFCKAF
jgi:hypothetical protein